MMDRVYGRLFFLKDVPYAVFGVQTRNHRKASDSSGIENQSVEVVENVSTSVIPERSHWQMQFLLFELTSRNARTVENVQNNAALER